MTRWSARSNSAQAPRNSIALALERRREAEQPLLDLTLSNPTAAGFDYPAALFDGTVDAARYAPDALGLLSAREAISEHMNALGVVCDPQRMWLTASTSEAYALLFKLLCDPGDEVLVPAPSYPLFESLAQLEGVNAIAYPLLLADDFRIDMAALRQRITDKTRAIVIVSPNNPTGSVIQQEELHALASLGLPILSDEVFGEYRLRPSPHSARTALTLSQTLVFSMFGLSKLVGLPQMKLGWTCINGPSADVEQALQRLSLIADTYLSVSTPVQLRVREMLRHGAQVRAQIQQRITQNLATLQSMAHGCPAITVLAPEAGWTVVVRVPDIMREEQWVTRLIEAHGVLVHPGFFYDFASEAYVVLSLLPEPEVFARGVRLLVTHVNDSLL